LLEGGKNCTISFVPEKSQKGIRYCVLYKIIYCTIKYKIIDMYILITIKNDNNYNVSMDKEMLKDTGMTAPLFARLYF